MSNILVTGGLGFIGSHLVQFLTEKYENRIAIIDNSKNNVKINNKSIKVYRADIRQGRTLLDIIRRERIDNCIHLAAKIKNSDNLLDLNKTVGTNVAGTLNVLQACAENKVKSFVFASTAAVYGEWGPNPLGEDHALQPLSIYGSSKIAGEALVAAFVNAGRIRNGVSLRFFNVYGKNHNTTYAGVISQFASRLSKGLPPIIYGTGDQTRDFVSVNDVTNAIVRAANVDNLCGVFNIGTGKSTSISVLADKMIKLFGMDVEPIYQNERSVEITHSVADMTKTKNTLQFIAGKDLDSGLKGLKPSMNKNKTR